MIINKNDLLASSSSSSSKITTEWNVINLKHPKNQIQTPFLIINDEIYELVCYNQELASVFIDELVVSQCPIVFATKFDYKYFILSAISNINEFIDIKTLNKQILINDKHLNLLNKLKINNPSSLFDQNDDNEIKYNHKKTIEWLKNKYKNINKHFEMINLDNKMNQIKNDQDSFELISQYINNSLAHKLKSELKLTSPLETNILNNKKSKLIQIE
jgi:hypothetical protein